MRCRDGIDMDSKAAENDFDLHLRTENAITRAVSGLGLGSTSPKQSSAYMMGKITIRSGSEIGKGTRIGFEIPRVVGGIEQAE